MKKSRVQDYIVSYDKVVLFSYLALCLIGVVMMLDISSIQSSMINFYRHVGYCLFAFLGVILTLYFIDLEKVRWLNPFLIFTSILLLVIVLMLGPNVNGATRQIRLGFIGIQPSFLARFALVFFFAGYLATRQEQLRNANARQFFREFLPLIVFAGAIFVLIILEKHLSTLVIGGFTLLGMLIYAGIRKRLALLILALCLAGGSLVLLKGEDYRWSRIKTYMTYNLFTRQGSEGKVAAAEYQVHESLTALTSGSLIGTGMARGRAKHFYLPEARTDYIYTIIGEEFGFLGAILVFLLHALLFFRTFKIAQTQENKYYQFLCAGLAMNIFLNTLVNTGVAMSILPPTGNTLPFISYGGTALMIDSISVGVILNISAKRRLI